MSEVSKPIVTFEMENGGIIKAELYPKKAENTVNNFISLVKSGFYDGLIFHRVIQNLLKAVSRSMSIRRDSSMPRYLYRMMIRRRWAQSIWITGACTSILNAGHLSIIIRKLIRLNVIFSRHLRNATR